MLLNFHRKSGLKNFSKKRPVVSCKSRESWKTKLFCQWNGAWSNILWRDRFPVATADKPVPTFGESLCLSWFFLGPQWNRHLAAVFCIFAWNHPSHFAVGTSHKSTAVVFPRSSGPVKSLMKATGFSTCFSWRCNGGCIFFRPGPKKIHEKYSDPMILSRQSQAFQPWATKTEIHAEINGCHLSQKKRIASVIEIVDLRKLPSFLESCVTIDESLVTTEIHYSTSMRQIQDHNPCMDRWQIVHCNLQTSRQQDCSPATSAISSIGQINIKQETCFAIYKIHSLLGGIIFVFWSQVSLTCWELFDIFGEFSCDTSLRPPATGPLPLQMPHQHSAIINSSMCSTHSCWTPKNGPNLMTPSLRSHDENLEISLCIICLSLA